MGVPGPSDAGDDGSCGCAAVARRATACAHPEQLARCRSTAATASGASSPARNAAISSAGGQSRSAELASIVRERVYRQIRRSAARELAQHRLELVAHLAETL